MFMFLGFTIGYLLTYVFLPVEITGKLFAVQKATITEINSKVSGNVIEGFPIFMKILLNNIKVLVFCLIFSLFYGSGAIFILSWNASVIATAMGNVVRQTMHTGLLSSFGFALG